MPNKKNFNYENISFDSNQEIFFYKWLQQAKQNGIVVQFQYQPKQFLLCQSVKINNKHALRQHVYTADYKISFDKDMFEKVKHIFKFDNGGHEIYVDIKGGFNLYNNHTQFSINRKWVYSKYFIYVYKIQVDSLFEKTFVPQGCRYTDKTKKLRQKYKQHRLIKQFMENETNERKNSKTDKESK